MKKNKILIYLSICLIAFLTFGIKKAHAIDVDESKYNNYINIYDVNNISSQGSYAENSEIGKYKFNYPTSLNIDNNKNPYVYIQYDISIMKQNTSTSNLGGIRLYTDTNEVLKLDVDADGKIDNSYVELINEDGNYKFYKIDLSYFQLSIVPGIIEKKVNLINIEFYFYLSSEEILKYDEVKYIAGTNGDGWWDSTSAKYEVCDCTYERASLANFNIYFENDPVEEKYYFFVDDITCENDRLNIYLVNTYGLNTFNYIVIDETIYSLEYNEGDLWHYFLSVEDTSTLLNVDHTFNITEIGYYSDNEGGYSFKLDENFTYTSVKKYVETSAFTLVHEDNPFWGYTHTYAYTAMFNSVHGRIKNAKKVKIRFNYSEKENMKNIEERHVEYDIPDNYDFNTDDFKNGAVRKLRESERNKSYFINEAWYTKLSAFVQGIDVATFAYDYEFKIRGYIENQEVNYTTVIYEVEAGSVYYGSFYENALNWDSEGNVFNGNGELQKNLKFNGVDIINVDTGEIVKPVNNSISKDAKENFFKDLFSASKEGTSDMFSEIKNLFSGFQNLVSALLIGVGLFVAVIVVGFVWKLFKKD